MQTEKITIPEELIQICRDMAEVAKKHGLRSCSGRFDSPDGWGGDISFSWEAGRHGEDSNEIKIASQFFVHTQVKYPSGLNGQRT